MRPPLYHHRPMNNDTITVSRSRYEGLFVLAITGWALALILIGAEIGRNQ